MKYLLVSIAVLFLGSLLALSQPDPRPDCAAWITVRYDSKEWVEDWGGTGVDAWKCKFKIEYGGFCETATVTHWWKYSKNGGRTWYSNFFEPANITTVTGDGQYFTNNHGEPGEPGMIVKCFAKVKCNQCSNEDTASADSGVLPQEE